MIAVVICSGLALTYLRPNARDYGCLTFLYADPTRDALQVFSPEKSPLKASTSNQGGVDALPHEEGEAQGTWIYANPMPGCIVCNVGEMWEVRSPARKPPD